MITTTPFFVHPSGPQFTPIQQFASLRTGTRKRLLLTGGATGIGRAVAIACAPPAAVVVADVNAADAERTVEAVGVAGGTAHFVRCDVTSEEEVRALIQTTEELIGGIDALVTAAGVLQAAAVPVEEIDPADWTRTLEVNVCKRPAKPASL